MGRGFHRLPQPWTQTVDYHVILKDVPQIARKHQARYSSLPGLLVPIERILPNAGPQRGWGLRKFLPLGNL